MWLLTAGGLTYFEDKSFHQPGFNEDLITATHYSFIKSIYVDSADNIYMGSVNEMDGYLKAKVGRSGSLEKLPFNSPEGCVEMLYVLKNNEKVLIYGLARGKNFWVECEMGASSYPLTTSNFKLEFLQPGGEYIRSPDRYAIAVDQNQEVRYFSMYGKLYQYDNGKVRLIREFSSDIIFLLYRDRQLFVCLRGAGVLCLNQASGSTHTFLQEESLSHLQFDQTGKLWASTLNNGVFKLNLNLRQVYTLPHGVETKYSIKPFYLQDDTLRVFSEKSLYTLKMLKGELRLVNERSLPLSDSSYVLTQFVNWDEHGTMDLLVRK